MKDKEMIHRFDEDVRKIQDGQPISTHYTSSDYAQNLNIARALSVFSSVSFSHTQNDVKKHLLEKVRSKPQRGQIKPRFSFVYSLGICVLLVLFSLAIPPVRAFAPDVIRQIGNFFFVNQPTDAENYVASMQSGTPTSTPVALQSASTMPQVFESGLLSAEEASTKAG